MNKNKLIQVHPYSAACSCEECCLTRIAKAKGVCVNHPEKVGPWLVNGVILCDPCYYISLARPQQQDPVRSPIRALDAETREKVSAFVIYAIDHLWSDSPDAAPDTIDPAVVDDWQGCCPQCCKPCSVLKKLLDSGELEDWVTGWPRGFYRSAWWDEKNKQVDRAWLARAWGNADKLACHNHSVDEEDRDEPA